MIVRRQSIVIIVKLIVFSFTTAGLVYVVMTEISVIIVIILMLLLIGEAASFVHFSNSQNRKLSYFFEAIRNEDTSLKFPENVGNNSLKTLHASLNDLNRMISEIKIKNETNERFYRELIEHSSTGLMSFGTDGYIEVMNSAAKNYLGVVQLSNLNLLKQKNQTIYEAITEIRTGEKKTLRTMVGHELMSLSIQSSELRFGDKLFKLISLQDIRHELEENEIDSWQKLIRVMTHEIMNSIAPITSLTNTLLLFFRSGVEARKPYQLSEAVISDTIEGLSVIEERGKGLIHFVDNYRKLAKVPIPVFAPLELSGWVHGIGLLFQPEFSNKDIEFSTSLDKNINSILTDEKLLNQVIINLMTNAIDAVSSNLAEEPKKISISIWRTPLNTVQIELSDNGCGIEETLMDKIFVPFFTTKDGGNGIGLSLSRQIVRKLRGKLTFRSQSGHGSRFFVEF